MLLGMVVCPALYPSLCDYSVANGYVEVIDSFEYGHSYPRTNTIEMNDPLIINK